MGEAGSPGERGDQGSKVDRLATARAGQSRWSHHPSRAFSLPPTPSLDTQEALSLKIRPGAMGCPHMGVMWCPQWGPRGAQTWGSWGSYTWGSWGAHTWGSWGAHTEAGLAPWTQEENYKPPAPPGSCPAPGSEEQEADFFISPNTSRGTLAAQDAEAPPGRMGQKEARQVFPEALR